MRAAVINVRGGPKVFRLVELPDPRPGDADVLIRVEAFSIEGGDLADRREGRTRYPFVLGWAAAGTIIEVSRTVEGLRIGQRVTTFAFNGSQAEMRVVPAAATFAVPDGLDMGVAAATPCGPVTAALALDLGRLRAGETVFVTSATGGVDTAAVQRAAKLGARDIGAARSCDALAWLESVSGHWNREEHGGSARCVIRSGHQSEVARHAFIVIA